MFHVVPQNDEQEHVCIGTGCPCEPRVQLDEASGEMICVHHAFDCREVLEQAAAIMNAAGKSGASNAEHRTSNTEQRKVEISDGQLQDGAVFNASFQGAAVGVIQISGTREGVQAALARVEAALKGEPLEPATPTARWVGVGIVIGLLLWLALAWLIFR